MLTPCVWPRRVCSSLPVSASQILTVRSQEADASCRPRGWNATLVTGPAWPLRENSSFADYQFIAPFQIQLNKPEIAKLGWGNSWFQTYVQVNDKVDMAAASRLAGDRRHVDLVGAGAKRDAMQRPAWARRWLRSCGSRSNAVIHS